MRGIVESFGKEDETLLQGRLKPSHTRSEAPQGRGAMSGLIEPLGEEDETLLQGGCKPCDTGSEAP
ncbi:hypothetical protein EOA60_34315 [Mesorhizobium sp. M1A.F.Ca.IN.020.06.1.1]|nr:hypothetical protein EOA60_34315 [Mesorhizobium sp. M1A.F.Ca.IN.020.06.1.1]RWG92862.1 MAG: hypothetical protein EOQ71_33015 [Mesorhizobium sp.]